MRVVSRGSFCLSLVLGLATVAGALPQQSDGFGETSECTITFDDTCPDQSPVCETKARGGAGCVVDGLPFCYESGLFSYRIDAGDRAGFAVRSGGVDEIEVFFAQAGEGVGGTMAFFDENGLQVGPSIVTNGICADEMPATQTIVFERRVTRIRVRAIDTAVYVDSMRLIRRQ